MSAQEFKVGQQVKDGDYERLPVGAKVRIDGDGFFSHTKIADNRWRSENGKEWPTAMLASFHRTLMHLPERAEPEDKDDLYVEPEPLKEDDWVQVWAQVKTARPDEHGEFEVCLHFQDGGRTAGIFARPDAIVRPGAGQMPPWVKPARFCPSLHHVADEGMYVRCEGFADHIGSHTATFSPGFKIWLTDDATVVEGGGAS